MSEIQITRVAHPGASRPAPRSPGAARAVRVLAALLILAGTLVLIDAGVTLVWQEPVSALYARLRQDHLSGALKSVERAAPTPVERRVLVSLSDVRRRIAYLAGGLQARAKQGSPVGRIVIPRIGARFVVVNGTSTAALRSGPGIYPETVFPGMAGTTAIAGHRTTYLAPFRHVDELHAGNRIMLQMPYAHFTYTVIAQRVVAPSDVNAAVGNVGYSRLVLSACTPLYSAAKRLLVFARLTRTVPVGAGRIAPASRAAGRPDGEALVGDQLEEPAAAKAAAARAAAVRRASRVALPAVLESAKLHLFSPPA